MQVYPSGNYIPMMISSPNYTSQSSTAATFLTTRYCNHPDILSSMVEIPLFNLVFHDGVTPVSISTLKPLLRVIGALPLKSQASSIISVCI